MLTAIPKQTYTNSGLDTTEDNEIDYITFLANTAHDAGLSIGLKNAGGLISSLLPLMEWSINESCTEYTECDIYQPFIAAGKAVWSIRYPFDSSDTTTTTVTAAEVSEYCGAGGAAGSSTGYTMLLKHSNLDSWIYQC